MTHGPRLSMLGPLRRFPGRSSRARVVIALAGASFVFAACGAGEEDGAAQVSEGQTLFESQCATCHGEAGLGDGPMAAGLPVEPPSLMEHLGHHPQDQLIRIIRTGVPPAMPPAALTEEQVRLVVDYAWTLVPDSMVAELREMQRMAEMGMPMDMGMGGGMEMGGEMGMDSTDVMPAMPDDSASHPMPRDTTGR